MAQQTKEPKWQKEKDDKLLANNIHEADENDPKIELKVKATEFDRDELLDLITKAIDTDLGTAQKATCPDFVYTLSRLKKRC